VQEGPPVHHHYGPLRARFLEVQARVLGLTVGPRRFNNLAMGVSSLRKFPLKTSPEDSNLWEFTERLQYMFILHPRLEQDNPPLGC
jgi:hypothetical protein